MNARNRKSYYTYSEGAAKEQVSRGFGWLLELAKTENKKSALLAVPVSSNLDHAIAEILGDSTTKLLKQGKSITVNSILSLGLLTEKKGVSRHVGTILAVYPSKRLLNKIDDMREVTDVLVIPWSLQEVASWVETWNAHEITGSKPNVSAKTQLSPIVEEALKSLTDNVNLSTGISHPMDKAKTIDLFQRLKKAKLAYVPDEVRGWLVRHGWDADDADKVKDIAERIRDGKVVRGGQPSWSDNIVEIWRERASQK